MTRGNKGEKEQALLQGSSAVIAAAAHELKTPLTLITYIAQMLGDESLGLTNDERLHYIQRLRLVSSRTLRLLQHMTTSYRLEEQGQMAFQFPLSPVNAREVCEAALHELTPYAKEYGQRLEFAAKTRAPLVVANREILYDVMVNLVDNAVKHNQPNTVVRVEPVTRGRHVRLQVHDTGQHVSPGEFLRLRESLGRPQPFSGRAGTSGLGLYIVHQLAGAMGGTLGLGRAREGTIFFVDMLRSQQLRLL